MRAGHILSGGAAALALFLCFAAPDARADGTAGAWGERAQVLYDAGTRSVVRRKLRVWDFHPEQNLDFTWEPAASARTAIAPDGTVSGEGKLVWRVRGSASYDPATVFSTYSGSLANGRPEGRGRLTLRSGESFEGGWRAGLLEGRGIHVDASGNRYEGLFHAGLPEGRGRLMLATGEIYSGSFRAGARDGEGETLLPGGTRYVSRWSAGIEEPGRRPSVLADAGLGGLLKADSTGGDAGRAEISVAVDARMNQQASDNGAMVYEQIVGDDAIAVFAAAEELRGAWNGTGQVTANTGPLLDHYEWETEAAFLEVGVRTTDGRKAKLGALSLDVVQSQVYRKPMLALLQHNGCVGFRPSFSIVNRGWGDPRNVAVSLKFTGRQEGGAESRAFAVPVGDFADGADVMVDGALREAGVNTEKLAAKRYNCQSRESMGVCQAQLFNDVGFGEIADYVWSDEFETEHFYTTATGAIDYDWSDDAGQTYHASEPFRVDIALATIETPVELAECGDGYGGAPEARRYQTVNLEPGRNGYSVDMPIRGNRNIASYTARLKMFAPMSSFHQFHITASFADGSVRESKPVSFYFFRPKPSSFETKTKPASCYLKDVQGCG